MIAHIKQVTMFLVTIAHQDSQNPLRVRRSAITELLRLKGGKMLKLEIKDRHLFINGKDMKFRISYDEMDALGELLSHAFALVYVIKENGERKRLEKIWEYDDSPKKITLREVTTHVEDDEIDTDYYIFLNDKSVVFHRYGQWTPDSLETLFFRLCKQSMIGFVTNYDIHYLYHDDRKRFKFSDNN